MPTPEKWRELARAAGEELGFDVVGVAGVAPSARLALFPDWITSGRAGEMQYLERRGESGRFLREDIAEAWPWARAVLCAGVVYNTTRLHSQTVTHDPERGWISRYAWGEDYHEGLHRRLEAWIERLRALGAGSARFQLTVDTAPLVEREAAQQAGLGWQGKNTCLIHPQKGSYFFLGAVLTSIAMAPDDPLPDRCGSCTRCLEACPTHALEPYAMDARRCLAYLNIELRGPIPEEFRKPMGNNLLGCDICQEVCPWNRKPAPAAAPEFQPRPGLLAPRLAELAALTEAEYREKFRRSAVKRAKYRGLRRNIAVAMGNSGNPGFLPILQAWEASGDTLLAEHAAWAIHAIETVEPDA